MKKYLFLSLFIFLALESSAEDIKSLPVFTADDRVLILAPHPDDETLGAAGVIQKALGAGAKAKVVCLTNGEHNQLAFIFYEKRLVLKRRGFIYLGKVRMKETKEAMKYLGLNDEDIIFLGYPDSGTLDILTKYWADTKPYRGISRISSVPYPECLSPHAPYVGESILKDLKEVIFDFKPTKIFVSHPADRNVDHQSLYLFLQVALWDLEGKVARPLIYPYLVHVRAWPKPRGYHPELELLVPKNLEKEGVVWQKLELDKEQVKRKYEALSFYRSQRAYSSQLLFSFARRNELFGDYPPIDLKEPEIKRISSGLTYAKKDKNLFITATFRRKIDEDFRMSIFLLGYSKSRDFSTLPKIHLKVTNKGLKIRDKRKRLFEKGVEVSYQGKKSLKVKIPLSLVGNPDYLITFLKTNSGGSLLPDSQTWRIIELD